MLIGRLLRSKIFWLANWDQSFVEHLRLRDKHYKMETLKQPRWQVFKPQCSFRRQVDLWITYSKKRWNSLDLEWINLRLSSAFTASIRDWASKLRLLQYLLTFFQEFSWCLRGSIPRVGFIFLRYLELLYLSLQEFLEYRHIVAPSVWMRSKSRVFLKTLILKTILLTFKLETLDFWSREKHYFTL